MKTVIMSLGGSVIVPDKRDMRFLKSFKKIILGFVKKNYRFVIYCGGGKLARNFQKAASKFRFNNKYIDKVYQCHALYFEYRIIKVKTSIFFKMLNVKKL